MCLESTLVSLLNSVPGIRVRSTGISASKQTRNAKHCSKQALLRETVEYNNKEHLGVPLTGKATRDLLSWHRRDRGHLQEAHKMLKVCEAMNRGNLTSMVHLDALTYSPSWRVRDDAHEQVRVPK